MKDTKRVFFVQEINKGEFETESIWCELDGENFVIDNIPMIAKRISLGDTITAEYDDEEKRYYFESLVSTSGNSTIRIYFYNDNQIEETRTWLNKKGCESEVLLARSLVALNIPKEVNYSSIKKYLDEGELSEKWTYEESCLEHEY